MSWLKKNKYLILLLFISLAIIGGYSTYKYIYKPHKKTEDIKASYIGNAHDFISLVQNDFASWNNKTIEIKGIITEIAGSDIILDNFIFCQLRDSEILSKKRDEAITIKGVIIGFDELLNELKLNQCIIQK